jgi:hypothetical protein
MPTKPKPRMGRPVTVGRGRATAARAITLRLSAAEDRALTAAAGSRTAVGSYLRGAGLALPLIVDALESGGDTPTGEEACAPALAELRKVLPRVVPRRDGATERPGRGRSER